MTSILKVSEIQDPTNGNTAMTVNTGGVVGQPNKPTFQVGLSANQSIPNATVTKITFNDLQASSGGFDVGGYFNTSNNRYVPLVSGYYFIVIQLRIETSTPDYLQIYIKKNGTDVRFHSGMESNAANAYVSAHTSTIVHMNGSTDYLDFHTYHNTGSAVNLLANYGQTQVGGFLIG